MTETAKTIKALLTAELSPVHLELYDDSRSHAGHAGSAEHGGGHYYATIVSNAFEGRTLIKRHQLVYAALGDLMKKDIHALSIKAFTPSEFNQKENQE